MKDLLFVGTALKDLCSFSEQARKEAGHQLMTIQFGGEPIAWKPMLNIGHGAKEIRLKDDSGQWRVVYVAKFKDAIYVLHAFPKKTQKTLKRDIDLAKKRYDQIKGVQK